jgi:hypothetical protein
MPNLSVAAYTMHRIAVGGVVPRNLADKILMTANAVELKRSSVVRTNAYGLVKVHERKTLGMPKAVFRLGEVLSKERIVWDMAIVACRDCVVAGLLPAVEVIPHDVAVGAGSWIVAQIRQPLTVINRVAAGPQHDANEAANDKSGTAGKTQKRHAPLGDE